MRLPVVPVAGKLRPKFARHHCDRVAPWNTVDEPELYVIDFSESPGAAEYRTRIERARREAWARYRDHLTAVFDRRGIRSVHAGIAVR